MVYLSRLGALFVIACGLELAACGNSAVCKNCQATEDVDPIGDTDTVIPSDDVLPTDTDAGGGALRFTVTNLVIETGECGAVTVETIDAGGNVTTVNATITLSVPAALAAYSDAGCATQTTSVQTTGGTGSFFLSSIQASAYEVGAAAPGLGASALPVTVVNGPPAALDFVIPDDVTPFECTSYSVRLLNSHGRPTSTPTNLALAFEAWPPPPASAGCNNQAIDGTLTIIAGNSQATNRGAFETPTRLTVSAATLPEATRLITPLWRTIDAGPDIGTLPRFRSVTLGADGSLWVMMESGQAMRSTDGGATWEARCRASGALVTFDGPLISVSAADGNAYAWEHNLRSHSGECLSNREMYGVSPIAIASDGDVYQMGQRYSDPSGRSLMVSRDGTKTWELVSMPTTSVVFSLAVSPFDETHILYSVASGLYRSVNGGVDFTQVRASLTQRLVYDPAHAGYVYADGAVSANDGVDWTSSSAHDTQSSFPFSIDSSGAGYRLNGDTTTTRVERAPDMRTPVWATIAGATFPTPFDANESSLSVSTDGQTIAVVVGGHLQLSINGGTGFTQVTVPENELWRVGMQVVSFDGVNLTALNTDWMVLTRDGAAAWQSPMVIDRAPDNLRLVAASSAAFYAIGRGTGMPSQVVGTQDRFANVALESVPSSSYLAMATSLADSLRVALVDPAFTPRLHASDDGGAVFATTQPTYPSNMAVSPYAVINPEDANVIWYNMLTNVGPELRALDVSAGTTSQISVASGFAPAAMEIYADGVGGYVERIVSRTGALVTSTDGLQTFSAITPGPANGECRAGVLASSPLDRDTIAFFNVASNDQAVLFLTRDAGATWRELRGPRRCSPSQLAFTATDVILSCTFEQPVLYSLDP